MANKFPFVFDKPFASEGDFVLPKFEADPKVANWPQGFSGRFSEPPEDGGLFIEREAMNGIHNALSQNQAWQQSGQLPTFDPAYVAKSGGYPKGAVLWNIPNEWQKSIGMLTAIPASATSWCGVEHYYQFNTVSNFYPVALMSVKDNNTDNFVSNQQFIGDSWALVFPDNPIEKMVVNFSSRVQMRAFKTLKQYDRIQGQPSSLVGYIQLRAWCSEAYSSYSTTNPVLFQTPIGFDHVTGRLAIIWDIADAVLTNSDCAFLCFSSRSDVTIRKLARQGNTACFLAASDSDSTTTQTLFASTTYDGLFYVGPAINTPNDTNIGTAVNRKCLVSAEYFVKGIV